MPRKKPLKKKVPRVRRKGDEANEFRKRVIDFYITEGNYQKNVTVRHFKKSAEPRKTIYNIIRNYEERRKEGIEDGWLPKKTGVTKGFTNRCRKYLEIAQMDPNVSRVEAAQILNVSIATITKVKRYLRTQKLSGATTPIRMAVSERNNDNGESSESILDCHGTGDLECNFSDAEPPDQEEFEKKPDAGKKLKEKRLVEVKKMTSRRCLVCFDTFQLPIYKDGVSNLLKDSLNVIFVLKCILDISSEELVEMLRLSKGADPRNWINICENCQQFVDECFDIHLKIKKLEIKLAECKNKISDSIKKTSTSYSRGACVKENLLVTKRVREIVQKDKRSALPKTKNPFEEGDKQAQLLIAIPISASSKSQPVDQAVKQERDLEIFYEDNNDPSQLYNSEVEDAEDITETNAFWNNSSGSVISEHLNPGSFDPISQTEKTGTTNNGPEGESRKDQLPVETNIPTAASICDTCGMEMRPLAIPMHMFFSHDFVMEGYTAKYCSHEGCEYKTLYDARFREHMRNHIDSACSYCGKRFLGKKNLLIHEQIHKNAVSRPYVCEICGASFAVDQNLYQHKRIKHQGKRKKSNQKDYRNRVR